MKLSKNDLLNVNDIKKAYNLIEQATHITLLTHRNPDGDGISACAALSTWLKTKNKNIETIYPNASSFDLKRHGDNISINSHTQKPDLLIMSDTATYELLYFPEAFSRIPSINIDHHISNTIDATVNFILHDVSSACEVLYHLLYAWDDQAITQEVAEALLLGILYDSQTFHTQSTYASTLRIAADLIDKGAPLYNLHAELLQNKNPQIISLWGDLLKNISFSADKSVAWAAIRQKDLTNRNLTLTSYIGFVNFMAQLSNVDVAILFSETSDGQSKASLRSKSRDVNQIAKKFGGGGHKYAAGITSDLPLDELIIGVTSQF